MMSDRSTFTQAIDSYAMPKSEPIYYVDLKHPNDPCLFVYRRAGEEVNWHKTIEEFWASALFNFLEDRVEDDQFEKLGAAGEYRSLTEEEATSMVQKLVGSATSEYIAVPVDATSCYVVYDNPDMKALVGTDAAGFFAMIWKT